MQAQKVRINPSSTNGGGRPPKNLPDANKDEIYVKAPPPPASLYNDTAKELWKLSANILCHRQQLKPAHLCLLVNYCNAFAVTVMTPKELIEHNLTTQLKDGSFRPGIHSVYANFFNAMTKSMQMLRLDPKTELYNSLATTCNEKGSHEISYVAEIVNAL